MLFFGACDFFSAVSYGLSGLITADALRFSLLVGPVYALGVWCGAQLFGRASERSFRSICYALIEAAVPEAVRRQGSQVAPTAGSSYSTIAPVHKIWMAVCGASCRTVCSRRLRE